jgi:hypothetical protein
MEKGSNSAHSIFHSFPTRANSRATAKGRDEGGGPRSRLSAHLLQGFPGMARKMPFLTELRKFLFVQRFLQRCRPVRGLREGRREPFAHASYRPPGLRTCKTRTRVRTTYVEHVPPCPLWCWAFCDSRAGVIDRINRMETGWSGSQFKRKTRSFRPRRPIKNFIL